MKLHLPLSLYKSLLVLISACTVTTVQAGLMHQDVALQVYTDFGQNKGRYVTSAHANELVQFIRTQEGGIAIPYTDGSAPFYIANEQGMINFAGTGDNGAYAAIAPNAMVTVKHNQPNDASYGEREVGSEHAINYSAIDINGSSVFRLLPDAGNGGTYDYMIQRQSKIVTDAVYNPLTGVDDVSAFKGQYLYHSGAGLMGVYKEGIGYSELAWAYNYTIGGINTITDVWNGSGNNSVISSPGYGDGRGACQENPLPNGIQGGDSGSPVYIYNASTGSYEYVAAQQSGYQQGGDGWSQARGNVKWTRDTLESFNARVTMSPTTSAVYLNAIDTAGETKTEGTNSATLYSGAVKDSTGNELVRYNGVQSGLNTWGDLSTVKDLQNWYAYDSNAYLQRSDAELFFSNNLVFSSNAAENTIVLNDTVDLGIGYAEFNGGKFTITSEDRESNQFNHAGYVINEGAEVHLKLVNPDDYMTEWRKTGAGALYIDGNGNTNALLNVGGSGTTYLQQTGGYAAYNVLASSGATVEIDNINQIKRDFTFGAGGGVLNMNGQSMEWNNSNGADADGFTIHALDEQAVIANLSRGTTTELTWTQGGSQTFLGSFRDNGKDSSLQFVYGGGEEGRLTMHSIKTKLTAPGSGITVNSGTLVLAGSHTVHGKGSATGRNGERLYRENDWHYADASAPVTVNGGTFELGSHARLVGDVTVAENATYVMREGVAHALEYVEGGVALEETSKYADYFGHKGYVILNGGKLAVQFNDGVDTNTTYGYNVSGAGDITVDAGSDGGSFTFSGAITATGKKTVTGGTLLLSGAAAEDNGSGKWLVESAGQMSVDNIDMIDSASTGTLVLSRDTTSHVDRSNHSQMLLGAQAGKEVQYGAVGTQETLRDWNLGGAGTLVVNYVVSGSETLTVDGRGHSTGSVKLQQIADDYSGTINVQSTGGRMVLDVGEAELRTTVNVKNGGVLRATDAVVSGENNTVELYGNLEYDSFTVRDGATLNLRENGRLDADTAVTIGAGGIMRLNRQTLQDKVELKNGGVMYGNDGTIGSSATVLATEGVGNLNAGGGTFTMDKGTIGAEAGATLRLENGTFNINSKDINSAGGTLELACSSVYLGYRQNEVTQTIGGTLKVANDLTIYTRQGNPHDYQGMSFNINHLQIDASRLTLVTAANEFRHRYNIASLTGSGTIHWVNNMTYGYKGPSHMILTGDNDFSGTLIVEQKCGGGSMQHVGLSHENAAKDMVINLWGDTDSRPGLAVSAKTAQVAGIGGTVNTFVYAGAIKSNWNGDNPASTAHSTLVIDTKGGDHVYNGTLLGDASYGLNIIKDGAGSQTFTNSENVVHDVTALQGSLVFTNAPTIHGDMGVAQGATLQIGTGEFSLDSGETLRVLAGTAGGVATLNNSLVLNGGTIEFGAYNDEGKAVLKLGSECNFVAGSNAALNLAFSSIGNIKSTNSFPGFEYKLLEGDWTTMGSCTISVMGSDYLVVSLDRRNTGLYASFTLDDDYEYWMGDAQTDWRPSGEKTVVITGMDPFSDAIELKEDIHIGDAILDNDEAIVISSTGGHSLSFGEVKKNDYGALVFHTAVEAETFTLNGSSSISGSGSLKVGTFNVNADLATGMTVDASNIDISGNQKWSWTLDGAERAFTQKLSVTQLGKLASLSAWGQATLALAVDADTTISTGINGTGTITKSGTGKLTTTGSVSVSEFNVEAGNLEMQGAVAIDRLNVAGKSTVRMYQNGTGEQHLGAVQLDDESVFETYDRNQVTAATTIGNVILSGASATIQDVNHSGYYHLESLSLAPGVDSSILQLAKNSNSDRSAVFVLGSEGTPAGNFAGTIQLNQLHDRSDSPAFVVISNENIAANAKVVLGDSVSASSIIGLGINVDNAIIAGLSSHADDGANAKLFSGTIEPGKTWKSGTDVATSADLDKVSRNEGDPFRTLLIDTAAGTDEDFYGQVMSHLNIVKTGAGKQGFLGNYAEGFVNFNGSIDVQEGTLGVHYSMLKAPFELHVADGAVLSLSGFSSANSNPYDLSLKDNIAMDGTLELDYDMDGNGSTFAFSDQMEQIRVQSGRVRIDGSTFAESFSPTFILASSDSQLVFGSEKGAVLKSDVVLEKSTTFHVNWNCQGEVSGSLTGETLTKEGAGKLTLSGNSSIKNLAVSDGSVDIIGELNLTEVKSGTVSVSKVSGTGTLGLNLSSDYGNILNVASEFTGTTHVKQGNFTINGSTFGDTLRLANGVNFQLSSESTVTLDTDLVLDGTSRVHQNGGANLTINGSVTGDGTYERHGGGTLSFRGDVNLGGLTQATDATTDFYGEASIGTLDVTSGTVNVKQGASLEVTKLLGSVSLIRVDNGASLLLAEGITDTSASYTNQNGGTVEYAASVTLGSYTQNATGSATIFNDTTEMANCVLTTGNIRFNGETRITTKLSMAENSGSLIFAGAGAKSVAELDAGKKGTTIELREGANLEVSGKMWLNKMTLTEGASFTKGPVKVTGASDDAALTKIGSSGIDYTVANHEIKGAAVVVNSANKYSMGARLVDTSVENAGNGLLEVDNAENTLTGVHATGGDVTVLEIASLELEELEIAAEKTITAAAVVVNELAKLEAGATLEADLTLASGATVELGGTMTLSGALELQTGLTLSGTVLDIVKGLAVGESYTLFEGVESLELQQSVTLYNMRSLAEETAGLMSYGSLMEEEQVAAADYFSNLTGDSGLVLSYDSENHTVSITHTQAVPEPTTATLSLLALAALAARRKRK